MMGIPVIRVVVVGGVVPYFTSTLRGLRDHPVQLREVDLSRNSRRPYMQQPLYMHYIYHRLSSSNSLFTIYPKSTVLSAYIHQVSPIYDCCSMNMIVELFAQIHLCYLYLSRYRHKKCHFLFCGKIYNAYISIQNSGKFS